MTIAQPNKDRHIVTLIKALLCGIGVMGVFSVYMYNGIIGLRAQAQQSAEEVASLRVINADLKNEYFARIDGASLVDVVERLGYVKELQPKYLKLDAAVVSDKTERNMTLSVHTTVYTP